MTIRSQNNKSSFLTTSLLFIYALSGAAALLYQVVWQRWLVFTIGLSSASIGIIVSAFLSGLGLGYIFGGYVADRLLPQRALFTFAFLEAGIAGYGLLSGPVLHGWLPGITRLGPESPGLTFLAVLALLLLPTFFMGASLPVLTRSIRMPSVMEQSGLISRLYFANTLGGAIAAVATAFLIVAEWGYDGAVWCGALLNLSCALGALILTRRLGEESSEAMIAKEKEQAREENRGTPPSTLWWCGWLIHAFAAGLTGIAWEILAFRIIENMVKSQAKTFALILGCFLAGLAFGGFLGDRLRAGLGEHRRRLFLASQTLLYVWLAGIIVLLMHSLTHWSVARPLLAHLAAYDSSMEPSLLIVNYLLLPALLLFIPALLMGFGFSLSQQLLQTSFAKVGSRLGLVQFVNIVGCVTGATLTTHVIIPSIGSVGAIKAVALLGVGYSCFWWKASGVNRWPCVATGLALIGFVAALPGQDRFWTLLSGNPNAEKLFLREDSSGVSSIRVCADPASGAEVFSNGLGQSVLPRALDTHHLLLGAIPTLIHPHPEDIGIIGLGSGGTLWGASSSPATRHIVAWEIMASQTILLEEYAKRTGDAAAAWFLDDPRIKIKCADGRKALGASDMMYDVIEADALRPTSAYAGNLYSVEFFRLVKSKLKPGGFAATWVPTPRVLETLRRVFPHVVYLGNIVALGSETPISIDRAVVRSRLRTPEVRTHFESGKVDVETLFKNVLEEGPATLPPLGPLIPNEINTDMHPRDELPSPLKKLRKRLVISNL